MKPLISFFSLFFLFILQGCKPDDEGDPKTLCLVTSADYPPFEFHQQGEVIGFDIDLANLIAEELGLKLVIQDVSFNSLIPTLNSGRADFAMSGLTVTPERLQNVAFSDVYFQPSLAILSSEKNPIDNVMALEGKQAGAQLGSIMEQFLREESSKVKGMEIKVLPKNPDLVQELKVGRLDAVVLEAAQAAAFAKVYPELIIAMLPHAVDGYAIAFPKDSDWIAPFNSAIGRLKLDGRLQALEQEWLANSN